MVDEQKAFNPIDLIEKECKSCFSEGLYFRRGGVGFSPVFFIEFLDLFIQLFDFFSQHNDQFFRVFGYLGRFRCLQCFEGLSKFEVHCFVIKNTIVNSAIIIFVYYFAHKLSSFIQHPYTLLQELPIRKTTIFQLKVYLFVHVFRTVRLDNLIRLFVVTVNIICFK